MGGKTMKRWFWLIMLLAVGAIVAYNFVNEEVPPETLPGSAPVEGAGDVTAITSVFQAKLDAMRDCDIEKANLLITERSKDIIHFTCANMANERECYTGKDTEILVDGNVATLYFPPFNYESGWPFFFAKEAGEWKIDYHTMSFGITMLGGGCDTGWAWRTEETRDTFCDFFPAGECPEE